MRAFLIVLALCLTAACGDDKGGSDTNDPNNAPNNQPNPEPDPNPAPEPDPDPNPEPDPADVGMPDVEMSPDVAPEPDATDDTGDQADADEPGSGTWQTLAPIAVGPRQEVSVVVLRDEVYVIGGFNDALQVVPTVEVYNPEDDTWRSIAPMPDRMHHANAAVVDDKIYIVGYLTGLGFVPNGQVFEYDPDEDDWTQKTSMPEGTERGASGTSVIDGRIFVAGGLRGNAVSDFSVYDPAQDTWETLPDHPLPLDHLVVGVIEGVFFTFGGRNRNINSHIARVFAFDPDDNQWVEKTPMPTSRAGHAAAVLDGRAFVFGGEGNPDHPSGVFDNSEAYDPVTDSWEILTPMLTRRHGTGAAAVGGVIIIPGGADVQAFAAIAITEAYTP